MMINVRLALRNYWHTRQRLKGGPYPHAVCSCGFCDVVRAADLLYEATELDERIRRHPRELHDEDRRGGS